MPASNIERRKNKTNGLTKFCELTFKTLYKCDYLQYSAKKGFYIRRSTIFLQIIIVLVGLAVFSFLIVEPHFEGRNANATVFDVYFKDPFLAYVYIASIPFFTTLYQTFKLMTYLRKSDYFLKESIAKLRTIKKCAFFQIVFIAVGSLWILLNGNDDKPPVVMLGFIFTLICLTAAAAADVFEKILT